MDNVIALPKLLQEQPGGELHSRNSHYASPPVTSSSSEQLSRSHHQCSDRVPNPHCSHPPPKRGIGRKDD
ncbi:hypothetical protein P7K49_038543, partial [Saguinus oedipus]